MIDSENTPVEQLWYTWSDVGLELIYAGHRIRAASPGLREFRSERVRSMERYRPYVLPSETDPYAITPAMAPVCLAFLHTEWGEDILVHKQYLGRDGSGRLGNYFTHLLAFGKPSTEVKLAAAFAHCIASKDDLVTIVESMKLVPKIDLIQLLYSLAEECAKLHGQLISHANKNKLLRDLEHTAQHLEYCSILCYTLTRHYRA